MEERKSIIILYTTLILVVALILVGGFFIAKKYIGEENKNKEQYSSQNTGETRQESFVYRVATEEDYNNFETLVSKNQMIQALPGNAKIVLSFYKFAGDERIWEKSYLLSKGSVKEGNLEDFDINLIMDSKYITVLNANNFCQIIKTAKQNNDFWSTTAISKTSLVWRYRGVLKYKDCFGL